MVRDDHGQATYVLGDICMPAYGWAVGAVKSTPSRFVWDDDCRAMVAAWRAEGRRYLDRLVVRRLEPDGPSVAVVLDGVRLGIVSPRSTAFFGGRRRTRSWTYNCHGLPGGGSAAIATRSTAVEACAVHAIEGAPAAKGFVSSVQRPLSAGRTAGAERRRADASVSRPNTQATPGATGVA